GSPCFSPPASPAVTALRKEADERIIIFSASTTRKKTRPPRKRRGQTQGGMASLSNQSCSGGAEVKRSCRIMTAPMPSGRYLLPRCALKDSDESSRYRLFKR